MNLNLNERFIEELGKCTDPTIFIGLARILKVKLLSEEKDEQNHFIPRPFEEIATDCVISFEGLERKRKKELLKIFSKANKEVKNAIRTENTKDTI